MKKYEDIKAFIIKDRDEKTRQEANCVKNVRKFF
jgi:hypothetical protein